MASVTMTPDWIHIGMTSAAIDSAVQSSEADALELQSAAATVNELPTSADTPAAQAERERVQFRQNKRAVTIDASNDQMTDLLWGADLCRAQGRLVDLVARAARFNEAMVRRTAKRTCGNVEASDRNDQKRGAFWNAARLRLGHRAAAFAARLAPFNPKASPWTWLVRDRKSTRLNSSHVSESRMPSSA